MGIQEGAWLVSGWHRHSREHALAAYGITCRAGGVVKDIVQFPESNIDYSNPEQLFTLFWTCSLNYDFDNFDWNKAFKHSFRHIMDYIREFEENAREEFNIDDDEYIPNLEMIFLYREMVQGDDEKYNMAMVAQKLYQYLEEGRKMSLKDKIILMDSVIDVEHSRGLWVDWGIDVDKLRLRVEATHRRYGHA